MYMLLYVRAGHLFPHSRYQSRKELSHGFTYVGVKMRRLSWSGRGSRRLRLCILPPLGKFHYTYYHLNSFEIVLGYFFHHSLYCSLSLHHCWK